MDGNCRSCGGAYNGSFRMQADTPGWWHQGCPSPADAVAAIDQRKAAYRDVWEPILGPDYMDQLTEWDRRG